VVVTAVVSEGLAVAVLHLQDAGRRMALVSLAEQPPPQLPGVPAFHLPPSTPTFQRLGRGAEDCLAALRAAGLAVRGVRSG